MWSECPHKFRKPAQVIPGLDYPVASAALDSERGYRPTVFWSTISKGGISLYPPINCLAGDFRKKRLAERLMAISH